MEEDNIVQSMEDLRASAVRLINQNLDFDALTTELLCANLHHKPQKEGKNNLGDSVNEQTIHESLRLQASLSEIKVEVAASQMILKNLCKVAEKHCITLNESKHLSAAFSAFKQVDATVSIEDIVQYQGNFQHCLPLNILLQLQESEILSLKDYLIINVKNKTVLKEFIWALQQITRQHCHESKSENSGRPRVAAAVLSHLVKYAYGTDKSYSKAIKKMSGYIVFSIVKSHLQYLIELNSSKYVASQSTIIPLIRENLKGSEETMQKCFVQMVTLWVTDSPSLKVSDAISTQHAWTASKQNETLTTFYKEITLCIGLEKIVATIGIILERREVNWKHLLTFTSAVLIGFSQARKALGDLISEKLKTGMETLSVESLAVSFLLARQLSLEGSHAFTSYAAWFEENFGPHSTLITSNRAARFLIRFLTDIAPFDPVRYLKAHIVKPPAVPPSCTETLKDYAMIARVRISELVGSLAEVTEESGQSAEIQKDVQNVLDEYKRSSKIPKSLMELSIFQKPYFCKKFLPALLKPRPLPAIPDTSMKLIEDLYKLQKISKNMYATYVERCKNENKKLLEEIMILDKDCAFEDDEDPHEQLSNILKEIKIEISGKISSNDVLNISSELTAKLGRFLNSICGAKHPDIDDKSTIDLSVELEKKKIHNKITHTLLDWFGGIQESFFMDSVRGNKVEQALTVILNVLRQHKQLDTEICCEIWKCCTNEISDMPEVKLRTVSLYLVIIGSDRKIKVPPPKHCQSRIFKSQSFAKSIENWQILVTTDLLTGVENYLQFYNRKESLLSALLLVCFMIQNLISIKKEPTFGLVVLFKYLGKRLTLSTPEVKNSNEMPKSPPAKSAKLDGFIARVEKCQDLYRKITSLLETSESISLSDFLAKETVINTKDDILNSGQRHHLYSEVFFHSDSPETELKELVHFFLDELSLNEDLNAIPNQEVTTFVLKCLPLLLEACEEVKSNAVFIYELMSSRLRNNQRAKVLGDDIQRQNQVKALRTFILRLPPSFLFSQRTTDNEEQKDMFGCKIETSETSKTENLAFVGKLINEYLFHIEKNPSRTFSLTSALTVHLITGLLGFVKTTNDILHFTIFTCPFMFISVLVHWDSCREIAFLVKLRNQELHSFLRSVHSLLSKKSAIVLAHKTIESKFASFVGDKNGINFCLAAALCDMPAVDVNEKRLNGLSKEELWYMASCAILKTDVVNSGQFPSRSSNATLLRYCLSLLDPDYACNTVLSGKLMQLKYLFTPEENLSSRFSVSALRSLSLINLPHQILKSEFFLPCLFGLKKCISESFSDIMLTEVAPDLRKLNSITLRSAPDVAVSNSVTRFPDDIELRFEAERRKLRIF